MTECRSHEEMFQRVVNAVRLARNGDESGLEKLSAEGISFNSTDTNQNSVFCLIAQHCFLSVFSLTLLLLFLLC